jgi:hypothetical protein
MRESEDAFSQEYEIEDFSKTRMVQFIRAPAIRSLMVWIPREDAHEGVSSTTNCVAWYVSLVQMKEKSTISQPDKLKVETGWDMMMSISICI